MSLQNKTVLITGGSSGLGFSLARKLLEKGCILYILGRHQRNLNKAATELNSPNIHTLLADVTNFNQLQELIGNLDIDVLINNAGVWLGGTIDNNSAEQISDTIDINLKGVIFTTKAILPTMLKKNNGYILNIVSTLGLRIKEEQAVYIASKFGVSGFTKSLELDLVDTNIKVVGFYPGGMNTQFFAKAGNSMNNQNWLNTDKVADIIVFIIEQDDTLIISSLEVNRNKYL